MNSRETILQLLRDGHTVSGGELSRRLGLSRSAIWKVVSGLRRDGYDIEAAPGRGYCLRAAPDVLTESEVRRVLAPVRLIGSAIVCVDETASTNSDCKRLAARGGANGTVVIANSQTAGRGRMNRNFQSPKDKGIYMSVLLYPDLPPANLLPLTALVGVCVCSAVERVCGARPGLKWPNDPVLNGKKLCGILTEVSMEGESGRVAYVVTGIGINVAQTPGDFSPEVAEMATSLSWELKRDISRPRLAAALIEELDRAYDALCRGELSPYLDACRRDCVNVGKRVQLISPGGQREEADAVGLDDRFGLIVRDASGAERVIRAGEVSVRGLYGYVE
ncbi:MAG: biotin--[Oscillibacter sp.]|nr:biotin--[acetyl-CoA-carboxylase] ligase [Oscillibacter sp.]